METGRAVHDSFFSPLPIRFTTHGGAYERSETRPYTLYTVPAENDSGFFFQCRCPSSGRPCKRKFITNESGFHLYACTRVCWLRSLRRRRRPSSFSSYSSLFPPTAVTRGFFLLSFVVTDRRAAAAAAATAVGPVGDSRVGRRLSRPARAQRTDGCRVVVSPDPFAPSCRPTANNDKPSPLQQRRRRRRPVCDRVVVPAASRVHPGSVPPGSVPPGSVPPVSIPPGSVPACACRPFLNRRRHKWPSRVRSDTGSAARA